MAFMHAVNGISQILIAAMCFFGFFQFIKKDQDIARIGKIFGTMGVFYLLMGCINILWLSSFLEPNDMDFLLLNTIITVVTSFLVTYLAFRITLSKNIIYLLILYITSMFAANYSLKAFLLVSDAVSYLLLAIVFIELAVSSKGHLRKAADMGILYCATSVFASVLYFFGNSHKSMWFVPTLIMGAVYFQMIKGVKGQGIAPNLKKPRNESGIEYIKVLARFMIFIVSLTAFVLVSAISIHELGHAFVAQFYGCSQYKAVIYDIISPHTEISCDSVYYNDLAVTLAGIFATTAIALVFLLTGIQLTEGISYLMAGFGLLISYGDLISLKTSSNLIAPIIILSFIMIVMSIVKISTYYLKQQEVFR